MRLALRTGVAVGMSRAEYRKDQMPGLYWLTVSLQAVNIVACSLICFALLILPILGLDRGRIGGRAVSEIAALSAASDSYKADFGDYPAGANAAIFKALTGENSKQKVYFEPNKNQISSQGEVVDPWGTPYRFYRSGDVLNIRTAGANRKFGDQDDVVAE